MIPAPTEIYTLSLHDALPIFGALDATLTVVDATEAQAQVWRETRQRLRPLGDGRRELHADGAGAELRSEEHTSELQSQSNLVCRLLLEKKKNTTKHKA